MAADLATEAERSQKIYYDSQRVALITTANSATVSSLSKSSVYITAPN
jgi:hypothetical protein